MKHFARSLRPSVFHWNERSWPIALSRCAAVMFIFSALLRLPLTAGAQMPGQSIPEQPRAQVKQTPRGFEAKIGEETLVLDVCADRVFHVVTRLHGEQVQPAQPWMLPQAQSCPAARFQFKQDDKDAKLTTATAIVTLSLEHGNLTWSTLGGVSFLKEGSAVPRTYEPQTINGDKTFHVVDRFSPDNREALYGLGQHQGGLFNYRGATVELGQNNTDIAIPLLVSSKGYGILWNTAAFTYVDNRFPLELKFDSAAGPGIDYFVLYGPEMDDIVHEYRDLTGHAPMLPRWSYGFIQSKDRYKSLDEIQAIAQRYRAEHIPADVLVQDWFWWKVEGDPQFNENYHDVPADLKRLHDEHFHTMISTWGLLDPRSQTYREMNAKNLLVPDAHVYDASNSQGRDVYWSDLPGKLFSQGWDSFWLDSAEPEEFWPHMGDAILRSRNIAVGNGMEYTNVFPLLHNLGIQEHWKQTDRSKRVFLLTRSSFLGQQRVGGTVWSGDVFSSYWGLTHQLAAGLNYALSGMPYWTTDIGGYWPTYDGQPDDPAYQELYLRWFQFGAFCPVFRSHGHRPHNEMWTYGHVEPQLIAFDKLRYRMMPYIYSLAWKVSNDDYTIQRPLVMDFRADDTTWDIRDQFMFGPALMVSPVEEAHALERRVYLPKGTQWFDFWTGEQRDGGRHIEAAAPLDHIPVYVKAGSILPLGPEEEYADEMPDGPIELRIYRGGNSSFTLYNDEGDNYNYEKKQYATIPILWNEQTATLTIGARTGSYRGMAKAMQFRIVEVRPQHGVGEAITAQADKEITYSGAEMRVRLNR
ncbi:MAG TPA: TIM-barrel domain-containing protein [Edaphobacter sp.]|nr:TIM-barrel domain-containing protein [Edaphobacter sp.]